jgi:hypothetical protein
LDKSWHSFWHSEERGWPVALSLLIAGLGLRPAFARQVVVLLENLHFQGVIKNNSRLTQFRTVVLESPAGSQSILREFRVMAQEAGFFKIGLPRFSQELTGLVETLLQDK